MIRTYRVRYEPAAQEALQEAVAYIKEQSGPEPARNWLRDILRSVDELETLPRAFAVWCRRAGRPIHAKLVPPYRVFSVIEESSLTVHVIDVVHTARETRLAPYREPSS